MPDPIGLLALQGDFERHRQAFAALGVETRPVRRTGELAACSGLVIPGGESTTLSRLIDRCGMREPLREFGRTQPVLGTCAGLILLSRQLAEEQTSRHGVEPLELLDCVVRRNAYGRQVDSFSEDVSLAPLTGTDAPFRAVYIRAPRIISCGPDVEIVIRRGDEPVGVRQGRILALSFHPELTADTRIHAAFVNLIGERG
jgi:5'-phosphate synthase pdxT subunit